MSLSFSMLHDLAEVRVFAAFVAGSAMTLAGGLASKLLRSQRSPDDDSMNRLALSHQLAVANLMLTETKADLERTRQISVSARGDAERASAAKSMFVANISHELRTPLNAVLGFSEVIEREMFGPVGNARYRDYARDIHGAASHLKSLIDNILDISRMEANKYEIHAEWLDLEEALAEPLHMVRDRATQAGLRIETEFDAISPRLFADRRALVQMALNLLSNAMKFTEAGGQVILRTRLIASGDLAVEVEDTGCGIPPEDLDRVLRPFEQVDNEHTRRHAGTGLGLPLVDALIRLHGGTLEIDSNVGNGTKIRLRFPAVRVALGAAESEVRPKGLCA